MTESFATLGFSPEMLRAIADRGYATPTPVQREVIPAVIQGRDVRASARTGSGKTAAFSLPLLERRVRSPGTRRRDEGVLVLVPTRELAMQVAEAIRLVALSLQLPVKVAAAFGGVSINPQMLALRAGVDFLVATPGRLLDLMDRNAFDPGSIATVVLDEADRLLDLGFADEIGKIADTLPAQRQSLFFSATFPAAICDLADRLLRNPVYVDVVDSPADPGTIIERAIEVDGPVRTQLLLNLLHAHRLKRVLVFVATQYATEHVAEKLRRRDIKALALHGQLSQAARTKALGDLKAGRLQVLVSTDIAARGLHIDQLPAVVNFDLPRSPVEYVHRIGRTGRAGEPGLAISFIDAGSEAHFRLIEKRIGRRLGREVVAGFEPKATEVSPGIAAPGTGGIKGRRKSKKDKLREAAALAGSPVAPGETPAPAIWRGRKPR